MLETEISRLLVALTLLLGCALVFGKIFQRLYLPSVFGEIFAGLVLGPSIFGYFFPRNYEWIFIEFNPSGELLLVFYYLGLIFLMLTAGLSIPRISSFKLVQNSMGLVVGALPIPFLVAFFTADRIPNEVTPNETAFKIVIACAASVTSIPVLSRIFMELGIISKEFATNILTAAAFQDLILWTLLSWAISMQSSNAGVAPFEQYLSLIAKTSLFLIISILILPHIIKLFNRTIKSNFADLNLDGYSILVTLIIILLANLLDVSVVFGALVAGIALMKVGGNSMEVVKKQTIRFSNSFLTPIYFALVGLRIDLSNFSDPLLIFELLIITSLVKIISVSILAKLNFKSWRVALDYGISMNARGGPGIVLASLAYDTQIIDSTLFTALILISFFTSAIAGAWLRWRKSAI